jgi:hypothetical protein
MIVKKQELVVEQTIHPLAVQQEQYMGLIQMAVEKGADINQLEKQVAEALGEIPGFR